MTTIRVDSVPGIDPDDSTIRYAVRDIADAIEPPAILDTIADSDAYAAAVDAWDRLVEDVAAEVRPKVVALVEAAYRRRLPWRHPA